MMSDFQEVIKQLDALIEKIDDINTQLKQLKDIQ